MNTMKFSDKKVFDKYCVAFLLTVALKLARIAIVFEKCKLLYYFERLYLFFNFNRFILPAKLKLTFSHQASAGVLHLQAISAVFVHHKRDRL